MNKPIKSDVKKAVTKVLSEALEPMMKVGPYALFGTNKDLESGKGVDLVYPGFTITIHRAGGSNRNYANALQRNLKPHRQRYERGLLDEETQKEIVMKSFVEGVVVGWRGVTDAAGKTMVFTPENAIKLFTDLPDLYNDVKAQADDAATFRDEQEKVEEKN